MHKLVRKKSEVGCYMKIAILGTGAIGGYIGGLLAHAGEDVSFIARGETLSVIRESGLTVQRVDETFTVKPRIVTDDPSDVGVVNTIIVCVKADGLQNAAELVKPIVNDSTLIVPTQNGISASKYLSDILGKEKVIEGICNFNAQVTRPGVISSRGNPPNFTMGEADNTTTDRLLLLQSAFKNAGFNAVIPENIQVALWTKLMGISALAGIESITRTSSETWRDIPSVKAMWIRSMEETQQVARSVGVDIPYKEIEDRIERLDRGRGGTTSMHKDIVGGRPSELEHQIGDIVRLANKNNVTVVVNSFIYHSLLPQEHIARKGNFS